MEISQTILNKDINSLALFLRWVDNNTYLLNGTRFWEDTNEATTEGELAEYYLIDHEI